MGPNVGDFLESYLSHHQPFWTTVGGVSCFVAVAWDDVSSTFSTLVGSAGTF